MGRWSKGIYKLKNPSKYKGNPGNIEYRSSWELKFMMHLDTHPEILQWGSEAVVVRYRSPIDNKIHRYFVDFIVTKLNKDGKKETILIEIKPSKQTKPPVRPKKMNKSYITEVKTWGVNEAKWKATDDFCKDRGWKFHIFTEKELGLKA